MLLMDTSGSMERVGSCVCSSPTCEECYPTCSARGSTRNRWATVLEALTGSYTDFSCNRYERTTYTGQFDQDYFIPHHKNTGVQSDNGILDTYIDRVKFGLMTFDGVPTLTSRSNLLSMTDYRNDLLRPSYTEGAAYGALGGNSYGEAFSFTFPGCLSEFMMDNGARNERATMGRLVSVGGDESAIYRTINQTIQTQLANVRPFGPTPIAGMLTDFQYYLNNHPDVAPIRAAGGAGDRYSQCREKIAILVTDGFPNADMRGEPVNCDARGSRCPYQTPRDLAASLCDYRRGEGCNGDIDGLYVVGFNIADAAAVGELNAIADLGGTDRAYFADDRDALVASLGAILDAAAPGTTTRTVPAIANPAFGSSTNSQLQFGTGFVLGEAEGGAWSGVLERRRFECNASFEPVEQPVEAQDKFHERLNAMGRGDRTLFTNVVASAGSHWVGEATGTPAVSSPPGLVVGPGRGGDSCGPAVVRPRDPSLLPAARGVNDIDLSAVPYSRYRFGTRDAGEFRDTVSWLYGEGREDAKLGDIYHSSPQVVGAPQQDTRDESFNAFRRLPVVENRPETLYVGSNDGILHAIATRDTNVTAGPHSGETITAGTELFGFIPSLVQPNLAGASRSHLWMVDSSPVIKDVFYRKAADGLVDPSQYHTVLVSGLRQGGKGYFALDVTDPFAPKTLWQFSHPNMGLSYGEPALGQVIIDNRGSVEQRAIAILPGGSGVESPFCRGTCRPTGAGMPETAEGADVSREELRCWETQGRGLFVIDVATGEVLAHFDDRTFNSPVTGSVALDRGAVGQLSTRAYVTDEDGVIWRLDMSSQNMDNWNVTPFYDMFHNAGPRDGQPGHFAPIVSVDNQGNNVVIQATGNVDSLEGLSSNRVVSITDLVEYDSFGSVTDVSAEINWVIPLSRGEQVTGPLQLFDSKVYFATFRTGADELSACDFGYSNLWGVAYRQSAGSYRGLPLPAAGIEEVEGTGDYVRKIGPFSNQIVMGVAVTQRPSCTDFTDASVDDPYVGSRNYQRIGQTGGGQFQLTALVSGGGTPPVEGATISEITRTLPSPTSFTTVRGWLGGVQ